MTRLTPTMLEAVAGRFRVLGEPMRLRLLHALRDGEQRVSDLVERTRGGQANVSKHLQLLFAEGFVTRRKDGTTMWYAIQDPQVFELCDLVCGGVEEELDRRRRALRRDLRPSRRG